MKEAIISNPLFGISITLISYAFGVYLNRRTRKAIFNPLLIAEIIIILTILIFRIPFSAYNKGGAFINMFLGPVTALLAYSIYRERKLVISHIIPLLAGTVAGSVASIAAILLLSRLFTLDHILAASEERDDAYRRRDIRDAWRDKVHHRHRPPLHGSRWKHPRAFHDQDIPREEPHRAGSGYRDREPCRRDIEGP